METECMARNERKLRRLGSRADCGEPVCISRVEVRSEGDDDWKEVEDSYKNRTIAQRKSSLQDENCFGISDAGKTENQESVDKSPTNCNKEGKNVEKLQQDISRNEQEVQQKNEQINKLNSQLKALKEKHEKENKKKDEETESEIKRLKDKVERLEDEVEMLKREVQDLKIQLELKKRKSDIIFLGAMCDDLQKNFYQIVFDSHNFSDSKQSYQARYIEDDITDGQYGLDTELKQNEARDRWKTLRENLGWNPSNRHVRGIKNLKYKRNTDAHPLLAKDMDEKENLEKMAKDLHKNKKLDDLYFGIVMELIDMWSKSNEYVKKTKAEDEKMK